MNETIHIFSNGEWKPVATELWTSLEGPKPYIGFPNDGCTFVRDRIRGHDAWPACVIHDWHFSKACERLDGERAPSFGQSNRIFMRNKYRCLRYDGMNRFSAFFYAIVRHLGVSSPVGKQFFRVR